MTYTRCMTIGYAGFFRLCLAHQVLFGVKYTKKGVACQKKAPMISDSNQVLFAKMSGCGLQEDVRTLIHLQSLKQASLSEPTITVWRSAYRCRAAESLTRANLTPISKAFSQSFGNTSLRLCAFFSGSKRLETTFE